MTSNCANNNSNKLPNSRLHTGYPLHIQSKEPVESTERQPNIEAFLNLLFTLYFNENTHGALWVFFAREYEMLTCLQCLPQMSTSLTVCVRDYWKALHFHNRPKPEAGDSCSQTKKPLRRLTIEVDAINGNYYLREFLQQRVMGECLQTAHGVQLIWLEFRPPERDTIDYRFAHMLAHTLWEHIEVEHLMSWLSTLGGGFSALGEQFERCVGVPGKPTKPTGNALNFYSDTGGDRRQDIAAAAEDRPPARRSLPAGPLQAVLQHLPDPARTAKGGQASHPAAVRLCASQRGEGCAAGADVPRHLAPAGLRVRAAQDTEDGQLKRHSHTMIYR